MFQDFQIYYLNYYIILYFGNTQENTIIIRATGRPSTLYNDIIHVSVLLQMYQDIDYL